MGEELLVGLVEAVTDVTGQPNWGDLAYNNLAQTLGSAMEAVKEGIRGLASLTDTGMEVNEMDLHAFLGEPEAEGYTRISGPIVSSVSPVN